MKKRAVLLIFLVFLALQAGCTSDQTLVDQIREKGKLTVVTRNSGTTYYQGPFGDTGLEYELSKQFAEHLGVELRVIVEENFSRMFKLLESGKVDIAAANLSITDSRKKYLQFGPAYVPLITP